MGLLSGTCQDSVYVVQGANGRSIENLTIWRELRPVTRTIPALFEIVPMDDAAQVSACGTFPRDAPVFGLEDGQLL
jgi:hypothetical protein